MNAAPHGGGMKLRSKCEAPKRTATGGRSPAAVLTTTCNPERPHTMAIIDFRTPSNVIDTAQASEARIRRAHPTRSHLPKGVAAGMDWYTRTRFAKANAAAVINFTPTEDLSRSMLCDRFIQAAKAAI